jgi:hypothetical protein
VVRKETRHDRASVGNTGSRPRSRSGLKFKSPDANAFNGNANLGIPASKNFAIIGAADMIDHSLPMHENRCRLRLPAARQNPHRRSFLRGSILVTFRRWDAPEQPWIDRALWKMSNGSIGRRVAPDPNMTMIRRFRAGLLFKGKGKASVAHNFRSHSPS